MTVSGIGVAITATYIVVYWESSNLNETLSKVGSPFLIGFCLTRGASPKTKLLSYGLFIYPHQIRKKKLNQQTLACFSKTKEAVCFETASLEFIRTSTQQLELKSDSIKIVGNCSKEIVIDPDITCIAPVGTPFINGSVSMFAVIISYERNGMRAVKSR